MLGMEAKRTGTLLDSWGGEEAMALAEAVGLVGDGTGLDDGAQP